VRRHVVVLIVGAVLAVGCGTRPCDSEVDPGARYRVTLVERYDPGSHFTFDSAVTRQDALAMGPCVGDGLAAGTTFELRGVGRVDDRTQTCSLAKAEPEGLPTQIMDVSPSSGLSVPLAQLGYPLIYTDNEVTIARCPGQLILNVIAGGGPGGMFGVPMEGQRPPVVLYRLFAPEAAGCPRCEDNFVAQLMLE
jgi:hypothetical protein